MTLPVDYFDAHRRHWADAELLFDHDRFGNADQLYGFSAECGLKAVMTQLGMALDDSGRPPRRYRTHVQRLWKLFGEFAWLHDGERYADGIPVENPFSDWSHHDRYARHGYAGRREVGKHRIGARQVRRMVQMTDLDEAP